MSIAGLHAIRSALSDNTYVTLPVVHNFLFAPVVARERSNVDTTWPPRWNIAPVGEAGSNVYNVSSSDGPISIWPEDTRNLTVFFIPGIVPPGNFSIEPAGDNLVRFHVPNEDSVWTQTDDSSQVTLSPDTGSTGQRWILENLD